MFNASLNKIAAQNSLNPIGYKPLSGGDINAVFLLKCEEGDFVAKLGKTSETTSLFTAEAKGLQLLSNSNSFIVPQVIGTAEFGPAYLLMEFFSEGLPKIGFWEVFAENLSKLHSNTQGYFGLDHHNFIGSLPQWNDLCHTASEFYISQRLEPQFRLAADNGFRFHDLENSLKNIANEIPNEPSALIHGDLWNGNYLVSENGEPVLIDPAVAYAPREMDLAMMRLFGGFPEEVFDCYNSLFPLKDQWQKRIQLWQLYYLLVHLNLFGSGYFSSVKSIISEYS